MYILNFNKDFVILILNAMKSSPVDFTISNQCVREQVLTLPKLGNLFFLVSIFLRQSVLTQFLIFLLILPENIWPESYRP